MALPPVPQVLPAKRAQRLLARRPPAHCLMGKWLLGWVDPVGMPVACALVRRQP